MKLSSVRDLKNELVGDTLPPMIEAFTARLVQPNGGGVRRATAKKALRARKPPIALGVAKGKGKGDYKLAVRLVQPHRIGARGVAQLPQKIHDLAKGEADIRIVKTIEKRARTPWYQAQVRPLTIGSSVGHFNITAGTLGAFVKCNQTGNICILSNNHVLANEGDCKKGDDVLQQGPIDGGTEDDNRVAELERWTKFSTTGKFFVDAAVASLDEDIEYYATLMRGSRPSATLAGLRQSLLEPDDVVWKIGRTTGFTRGKVTAIELDDIPVDYDMGEVTFDNQVEIEGANGSLFSDGGDSGSLIVDANGKACALLFAGGEESGGSHRDLTYANPIKAVMDALDVKLAL